MPRLPLEYSEEYIGYLMVSGSTATFKIEQMILNKESKEKLSHAIEERRATEKNAHLIITELIMPNDDGKRLECLLSDWVETTNGIELLSSPRCKPSFDVLLQTYISYLHKEEYIDVKLENTHLSFKNTEIIPMDKFIRFLNIEMIIMGNCSAKISDNQHNSNEIK